MARARSRGRGGKSPAQGPQQELQRGLQQPFVPMQARTANAGAADKAGGMRGRGATPEVPPYKLSDEIGAFGTKLFAGMISDEYNADLRGQNRYRIIEQMRRSDGQVRALLNVLKLPIRSATWTVDPHNADDEESVAQADFVRAAIFEHMEQTWADVLRDALLCVDYGFMLQEKVYARRRLADGPAILPRYLAFRHPSTIWYWNANPQTGRLVSVTQVPPPTYTYRTIPATKLLIYSPEEEGANWEGMSVLRAAYKHWFIKEKLYILQAIALARSGMGIPYIKLPDDASDAEKQKALDIVTTLKASEQAGVTIPAGWEFAVLNVGQIGDFQAAIEHHDLLIARSALAQFLNLGSGNVGSYALSQDQAQLLLQSLNVIADHIAARLNQGLIRELVRLNYDPARINGYPKLKHDDIGQRDMGALASALSTLVTAQVVRADDPLEKYVRDVWKFPPADPATKRDAPGTFPMPGAGGDTGGGGDASAAGGGPAALQVGADGSISAKGGAAGGGTPDNVVAPDAPVSASEVGRLLALADLQDALAFALEGLGDGRDE